MSDLQGVKNLPPLMCHGISGKKNLPPVRRELDVLQQNNETNQEKDDMGSKK